MALHDRSYKRWHGDRSLPVTTIPIIAAAGIRAATTAFFKRKIPAVLLTLMSFSMFLFGMVFIFLRYYVQTNMEVLPEEFVEGILGEEVTTFTSASGLTIFFYLANLQVVFAGLACLLMGSGQIANDRRTNALEMYLSRPVTAWHYVVGKFGAVGFFVALVTVFPAVMLVVAQLLVSFGDANEVARLLDLAWRTVAAGAVLAAVPTLLMLTASSLAQKARNAAILWFGFLFLTDVVIAQSLIDAFGDDRFLLFSIAFNIRQVMAWFLQPPVEYLGDIAPDVLAGVPVAWSALALGALVAVCLVILLRRVRPVEVVG